MPSLSWNNRFHISGHPPLGDGEGAGPGAYTEEVERWIQTLPPRHYDIRRPDALLVNPTFEFCVFRGS